MRYNAKHEELQMRTTTYGIRGTVIRQEAIKMRSTANLLLSSAIECDYGWKYAYYVITYRVVGTPSQTATRNIRSIFSFRSFLFKISERFGTPTKATS